MPSALGYDGHRACHLPGCGGVWGAQWQRRRPYQPRFECDFYAGVDSDKELGHIYADDMENINIPEDVRPYFDFEAYGRKMRSDDKGCFVNGGYLMCSGVAFEERYHGPEDIP